jgi:predicted ATPase
MEDNSKQAYIDAELDAQLLTTPFRIQTSWHVITGTISSGKTTLIEQLAARGYQTVPEAARIYIDQELVKGRTINEIRGDLTALQRGINNLWLSYEQDYRADEVLFLDRAFPDALAFSRVNGLDPNEYLAGCFTYRYASVFILEALPLHRDGVRYHDVPTADLIDEWLVRDYTALGYQLVRVPVMPVEERAAFILERLFEQGLI